jgi:uncharacterized protein with GYD domain
MGKIRLWEEKEYEFLRKNYSKKGAKFCSDELDRTIKATRRMANKIGISVKYCIGRFSEENMVNAIGDSKNIKETLIKMGLRAAGGNYKVFHDKIKEYEIDTSHFESSEEFYKRVLKKYINGVKIPLSEILIENSTYCRTSLKKRLYDDGFKQRICEMPGCGQGEVWLGNKISLILDHINGVYNDNRLENLRIVCPNCNAALPTHCGKHNAKTKPRKDPSIRIKSNLSKRIVQRPPYSQLKQEVLEIGYSATGRKYGVSDNSIRKWIKSYEKYGQ